MVSIGIATGAVGGYVVAATAAGVFHTRWPGVAPVLAAAAVLACAGVVAALVPAARASRVDVLRALNAE